MGQTAGTETVTLTTDQIPSHSHVATLRGNSEEANSQEPSNKAFGVAETNIYNSNNPENGETLNSGSVQVAPVGGNQPHNNMQPYLTVNYCIALVGVFPPRS
jgi:microcystin-dependent protein